MLLMLSFLKAIINLSKPITTTTRLAKVRTDAIFEQQIACMGCLWPPMKAGSRFKSVTHKADILLFACYTTGSRKMRLMYIIYPFWG